jgi:O-antigen/teichoic acid export membrane protein
MEEDIEELVKTSTRGSIIILAGQISSTLVLAIGMLLVAKFLGPSNYGSFNKALSILQIAFLIMNLGISSSLTKLIAQYRHENKPGTIKILVETGVIISFLVSIFMTLVVYGTSGYVAKRIFFEPEQQRYIQVLSFGLVGQALITVSSGIVIGYERMELRSIQYFVYSFLKSIISPVLIFLGYGTLGAVIGHTTPILLSGVLGVLCIWLVYSPQSRTVSDFRHIDAAKMIFTYGFPIYLSIILTGILPHFYTTLLSLWVSNENIGNYSIVLYFGVLLSFVIVPITTAIFPLFSKLEKSQSILEVLYINSVKCSTLFAFPIAFTIMALADQIIWVLFQGQYTSASHYLRLYMLIYVFIGLGGVSNGPLLNSQKRTDITFRTSLIQFMIAFPLNFYLIPRFGVVGQLFALFLVGGINTVLNLISIRKIFGFNIDSIFFVKILGISIFSYIVVFILFKRLTFYPMIELVAGGLLSLLIYLVGFFSLNVFTQHDFIFLRKISDSLGPFSHIVIYLLDLMNCENS